VINFGQALGVSRGRPNITAELNANSLFVLDLSAVVDNVVAAVRRWLGLAGRSRWQVPASVLSGVIMSGFVVRAALAVSLLVVAASAASSEGSGQNEPGQFDFYVLSLSWSPSFCASAEERGNGRAPSMQCGARPYSFVVHGLWPQYDKGFPEYCQMPAPRLNHDIVSSILDLMPAPRLIFNEWDKHGTCSGLAPRAYFETVRKARAVVKIPPEYTGLQEALSVTPTGVEDAFAKANPGLSASGMAVECDKKRLTEIRICLSKDLQFRDCPEIARRTCRREQLLMPPLRGG
jgi:ribonuclease T2